MNIIAKNILDKNISFRKNIENGNFSCVGIPYENALKSVNECMGMHDVMLDALKDNLSILKQTQEYRRANNLSLGNIFLETCIENTENAIKLATK